MNSYLIFNLIICLVCRELNNFFLEYLVLKIECFLVLMEILQIEILVVFLKYFIVVVYICDYWCSVYYYRGILLCIVWNIVFFLEIVFFVYLMLYI